MKKKNFLFFIKEDISEIFNFINNSEKPIQFKDFKTLTNPITFKKFSTSTLSIKLKEFENEGLIKKEIISKNGRTVIGYLLTEKGNKTIEILKETENHYKKL